ncbi:MAG: hypothetical protein IT449_00895 [Phycisphaerales bacterium]|nr:hypothetical protein [Phycisphaerales bacterium]
MLPVTVSVPAPVSSVTAAVVFQPGQAGSCGVARRYVKSSKQVDAVSLAQPTLPAPKNVVELYVKSAFCPSSAA